MRLLPVLPLVLLACTSDPEEENGEKTDTPEPSLCEVEGWTQRDFITEAAFGPLRREVADDFTLLTTEGDWTLSEQFTGCETYVFVPDNLTVSPLDDTPLLDSRKDLKELIANSPRNTHYFFLSASEERGDVGDFADAMATRVEGATDSMNDEDQTWWRDRLHVVSKGIPKLNNWVEDAMLAYNQGFAIDRFQRLRGIGSLADVERYDGALDSAGYWPWTDNLAYVAHEPRYYNYESDREDELALTDWTAVYLFYNADIAGTGISHVEVELPDAATMATFDTMLVDLSHICDPASQEWGNCDAWDAVQKLMLCDIDDPDDCSTELARYITTYHREGRWLADSSQLLPYIADGGTRRMHAAGSRHGHFNTIRLLLGNTGKGAVPYQLEHLWEGGSWSETYNDDHAPIEVQVPADATRVYLQMTLSGHGMSDEHNCAEFCDHQHTFSVGGAEFVATHPEMGNIHGCLNQIDKGTVPNQYGTWWYERSSWCPGKQVDPWVWDITDQVTPGQSATISYWTNYDQPAFGGSINLHSWIVYWR